MSVSQQLLELFRVDKQLRGLRNRLDAAERFYAQQSKLLSDLEAQKKDLESESKKLRAQAADDEGEANRVETKLTALREQMNSAQNSKEYNAFLTELNTFKQEKSAIETRALEVMQKTEELAGKLEKIKAEHAERAKIAGQAKSDRDARHGEIKDRLAELSAQREKLAAAVPNAVRLDFEQLVKTRGDEAMAPVEIIDRRSHDCSCSACQMAIPVEAVSGLLTGKLTRCPSCRCFLFIEQEAWDAKPASNGRKKKQAASL